MPSINLGKPGDRVTDQPNSQATSSSNRKVVLWCVAGLACMFGVTAASPTLYSIFCQVTGYGGTTQRAEAPSKIILDRTITVRFDANVQPGFDWKFEPVQPTMDVKIGDNVLAFYRATNTSDKKLTGTAAFNVAPETMGLYFSKIECFCFKEQTLEPGQSIEMPLTFYVDPDMIKDRDTKHLSNVTLSYVFYPVNKTAETKSPSLSETKSGG
jgi:cytochrome c oxidase assembly protein subunit 11